VMSRPADLDAVLYEPGAPSSSFLMRLASQALSAFAAFALLVVAGRGLWRRYASSAAFSRARHFSVLCRRIAAPLDPTAPFRAILPAIARLRGLAQQGLFRVRRIAHRLAGSAGGRPNVRPTDLNAILRSLEGSIRKRLRGAVTCRLSLLPGAWLCETDPAALSSLILDLVAEAVAFMPTGGELVVGTRQYSLDHAMTAELPGSAPGDYLRLTVKDGGRGLSSAGLERVFYPKATARPAAAAAWQLTRRLGGFAAVESAEGVGTAVHLYFRRSVAVTESVSSTAADEVHALAAE
jgi:signal transduction histidine kinase